jgi:hypothetical protein
MGEREKPPFKSVRRQPEEDDPMFTRLHIAFVNDPQPSTDEEVAAELEARGGEPPK